MKKEVPYSAKVLKGEKSQRTFSGAHLAQIAMPLGGIGAGLLGFVADATGIPTVIALMAILPIPAVALALSLPREARPEAARGPVAAGSLG